MRLRANNQRQEARFGGRDSSSGNGSSSSDRSPRRPLPPRLRGLLLVAGIVVTLILLFIPSMRAAPPASNLSFSAFSGKVAANQVATATIDPNGAVSGQLKGGGSYKSQIPLALQDNQLTPLLQQHRVSITGTGP